MYRPDVFCLRYTSQLNRDHTHYTMSYNGLHFDARLCIARTSITAWNALMRADPVFGRYALSKIGRSAFLSAFTVVENGVWRVGGKLHRIDGPAYTSADGVEAWYKHGNRHRIGGPAVSYASGCEEWFEHGKYHRIGGPAYIYPDGRGVWFERGLRSNPRV